MGAGARWRAARGAKAKGKRTRLYADGKGNKLIQSWKFTYEKVRFEDDNRTIRPLIVSQSVSNESEKLTEIKFWFIMFDFAKRSIVEQIPLRFPELELLYLPNVSISASNQMTSAANALQGMDYAQNF